VGWPEAARRRGGAAMIGQRREGDEANGRGPHGSDVRERRCHFQNAQT
jgi:hypothetical protein